MKHKSARKREEFSALAAGREYWQNAGPFEPIRPAESLRTRYAHGKALRKQTPRESHAEFRPALDRQDAVTTVLASNVGREEALAPLRIGRMAASPFTFLRGAAAVMAGDLAHTPISGPQVIIDGDAHINNFGLYGTPQRDIVIDINDFDEVTLGPWEWDLKRLVASVDIVCRDNGLDADERHTVVKRCVSGYALNAHRLAQRGVLETWSLFAYADLRRQEAALEEAGVTVGNKFKAVLAKSLAKARRTTSESLLAKITRRYANGTWRFVEDPPVLTSIDDETRAKVIASLVDYADTLAPAYRLMLSRYAVADVCHRVVGVGSVGLRAYLVLLFGNSDSDPLMLQVKQAAAPAHAPYLPAVAQRVEHEGRRVTFGQRALQSLGDLLLGYTTIDGRPYFVRQMKNLKASMPIEFLTGYSLEFWSWCCGALLSRAHARTGDIVKIAGYIGKSDAFASALADFADAYGDQTERDHAALVEAVRSGRVEAHDEGEP